jgi:Tfp pilus assembly protein PilF
LKLLPGDAGVWNNLGTTLDAQGRTAEALAAFRRATDCNLPSQTAFLGAALIQIREGNLDAAAATLDRLEQFQRPPAAETLAARAVIARRRGDVPRAEALEQQARALKPDATEWVNGRVSAPTAPRR